MTMTRQKIGVAVLILMASSWVNAGVRVIYLDEPDEPSTTTRNLEALKDVYRDREVKLAEESEARRVELEELKKRVAVYEKREIELAKVAEEEAKKAELAAKAKEMVNNPKYDLIVDKAARVVSHIGSMPQVLPALNSEGDSEALKYAFRSHLPTGWKLYMSKELDEERSTNWNSEGKNWVRGLYDIGIKDGYQYNINWIDRWVLVNESDLLLGGEDIPDPKIRIDGINISPGQTGHILIDNKLLRIQSLD